VKYKPFLIVLLVAVVIIVGLMIYPWPEGKDQSTAPVPGSDLQTAPLTHKNANQTSESAPKPIKSKEKSSSFSPETPQIKPMGPPPAHLEFIGTATQGDENPCAVIRNTTEENEDIYCVGDRIDGGSIIRIEKKGVLVEKPDQKYILPLAGYNSRSPENTMPTGHDLPPADFSRPSREQMEQGWEAVQTLMQQIEFNAHISDEALDGVAVGAVKDGSAFDNAGLKPGDIIHEINDKEIIILDDAMEIYETFRNASSVHIKITRNGEPAELTWQP